MLKGKSVIELTDVRTNRKDIYEDENLITNAVPDLLRLNPSGLMYPIFKTNAEEYKEEIFPISNKCYGGILLFEAPLDEDSNKYIAPANNKIIGYASNDVNSTDAPKRGSANLTESTPIENGYKFVWDFSTSQANGRISALALTHYRGGTYFYGDAYGRQSCLRLNYTYTSIDNEILKVYVGMVEADAVRNTITSVWPLENKTLEILKMQEPLTSLGLNDPIFKNAPQNIEKTTISIEDFYKNIGTYDWYESGFFDGKDGYYYGFIRNLENNYTDLNRIKIKKDDCSYKIDHWKLNNIRLYRIGSYPSSSNSAYKNGYSLLKNGYLYVPNNDCNKIYKINANNPVDVSEIAVDFEMKYTSGESTSLGIYEWGDYILGYKFVIDGDDNIIQTSNATFYDMMTPSIEFGPFRVGYGSFRGNLYKNLYLHTPYLGTINNLSSPILKTADKTMKITYTLTEEE